MHCTRPSRARNGSHEPHANRRLILPPVCGQTRPHASDDYRAALTQRGLVASMSRTGDCYDNAVAESFFATLKTEHLDHEQFVSREQASASIAG
jgi:transposase InsO family protein